MSAIKHNELYDFVAHEAAIKEANKSALDFGKTLVDVIKRVKAQQGELKADLMAYADSFRNLALGDTELKKHGASINAVRKEISELKSVEQGLASIRDLGKASIREMKAEYKGLQAQLAGLKPSQANYGQEVERLKGRLQIVVPQVQAFSASLKVSKTTIDAAQGSYKAMQNELGSLRNQLRSIPGAFDAITGKLNTTDKDVVDLANKIGVLDKVLKQADQSMGLHFRQTGNYATGFNGLSNSINQLTREAPAFAVSMQTGFLALSNNLPILFDEITRVKQANIELAASGEKPKSVFKQLAGSVFSFGTLLSIGVTLLTLYGDKIVSWVSDMFTGAKAVNLVADKIKLLGDVQAKANKDAAGQIVNLKVLYKTATEANIPLKERLQAVKDLQKEFPYYFGKIGTEIILNGKAKQSYDELYKSILQTSRAQAAKGKLEEIEAQRLDLLSSRQKVLIATSNEANKVIQEATKMYNNLNMADSKNKDQLIKGQTEVINKRKQAALSELDIQDRRLSAQADFLVKFAGGEKDIAKIIGGNEGAKDTGKSDLGKLKERIAKQQEFLQKAAELLIKQEELRYLKGKQSEFEFQNKKLDIQRRYLQKSLHLENELGKNSDEGKKSEFKGKQIEAEIEFTKFLQDQHEERTRFARAAQKEATQILEDDKQRRIAREEEIAEAISAAQKDRTDTIERRIDRELEVENKLHGESYKRTKAALQEKLLLYKNNASERERITRELQDLEIDLEAELNAKIGDLLAQLQSETLDIFQNISQGKSDQRIATLENEKERELKIAGNNAEPKEKIQKEYEKKIAAEKKKRAKSDQDYALAQIAIDTAVTVAKTASKLGFPAAIPFIAIAVAQGLFQAALVKSQKIPQFAKGTKSAPAGKAIVGEEGFELVQRGGRMFVTPNKPTIVDLKGGERIIPHNESQKIIDRALKMHETDKLVASSYLHNRLSNQLSEGKQLQAIGVMAKALNNSNLSEGISEAAMRKIMVDTIGRMPIERNIWDERGYLKQLEDRNSRVTYLNAQRFGR